MRRWQLTGLAALLLILAAPPLAAAPGCAGEQRVQRGLTGSWATYDLPAFPTGPPDVVAHAADPRDEHRWWATNGVVLSRSTDGGCSWRAVFTLPDVPTPDAPVSRLTDRIAVLTVPASVEAHDGALFSVEVAEQSPSRGITGIHDEADAGAGTSTVVFAGTDTFRALAPLASGSGSPGPLVVAPSDHRTVYAVAGGIVNASRDAGASWRVASPRPRPVRSGGGGVTFDSRKSLPAVSRLAVDPLDAQVLWAAEYEMLYLSENGGSSFEVVVEGASRAALPLLAVAHPPGSPPRVTVGEQLESEARLTALRISDGEGFVARPTTPGDLGPVVGTGQSMAAGPARTDLVLTTSGASRAPDGLYVYSAAADRLVAVNEFGPRPLRDVQRTGRSRTEYVFRTAKALVRWEPDLRHLVVPVPATPPPAIPDFGVDRPGGLPPLSRDTRVLAPSTVRIAAGSRREVPLTLELAPEPTPLDVFFLLDTSTSMDDVIDALEQSFAQVADELAEEGIDAWYGLGDYQDTAGVRYRRLVDISPADGPLREALHAITTRGGAEPAYTALHQMATGSGVLEPARGQPVPGGQHASWRPGSLRVVVHATDEVPSSDPDGPDRDSAVAALRADRTQHVGIEVVRGLRQVSDSELAPPGELNDILRAMSRDTSALAPTGGIDCDGDGKIDIAAQEPLVCELVPLGNRLELAPMLLAVLGSLVDEQSVGIAVGPEASLADLQAGLVRTSGTDRVDVKQTHRQEYSLSLSCPSAVAETSHALRLRPKLGDRLGRTSPLHVVCQPLSPTEPQQALNMPPPQLPPHLPPTAALLVPALPPPPPPPPAPVSAPAPAAAPAAMPAGAPAPAIALAPEGQQVELAFARQDVEQELAMVDRRRRPDVLALRLLSLALVCAAATRVALHMRPALRGGSAADF
jgi:hypothetical protein